MTQAGTLHLFSKVNHDFARHNTLSMLRARLRLNKIMDEHQPEAKLEVVIQPHGHCSLRNGMEIGDH